MNGRSSTSPGAQKSPPRAILDVRVTPRASCSSLRIGTDGLLLARVNAAPVDGAANKALVKLLADTLRVAPSHITIVGGQQSRHKQIMIEGLDADHVRQQVLGNASRSRG